MKSILLGLAAATLIGSASYAAPARVAPADHGMTMVTEAQYRMRPMMRHRRVCSVETVRTRTPRGVVIRKIRRCR